MKEKFKINSIIKKYNIKPPFIHKGFHAKFYPIDFVQLIWNEWGRYSGYYYKLHISTLSNEYWDLYYLPEEFTKLRNNYFHNCKKDKNFLSKHFRDWQKSCKNLNKKIKDLDKSFRKSEFQNIFKFYKIFVKEYIYEYALSAPIQEACGFQPEQWIFPEIKKYTKKYNLGYQNNLTILTSPITNSFINEEEIDLFKMALKLKNNHINIDKEIKNHQKKWFWIENNYADIKILDENFFVDKLSKLSNFTEVELRNKLEVLESNILKIKEKKADLYKKYPLHEDLKNLVNMNEIFAQMQDYRKQFVLRANHYHKIFLEKVSRIYNQNLEDLWYYSYNELIKSIENTIFINAEEINKRREMIVELESKKEKIILSGDEAILFFNNFKESIENVDLFKGLIAQTGNIKGLVKIILKNEDMFKIKEGDILVTSMTRPEMISAMRIASAFITDEGGITCHAAIIAREMEKPCIIGTKIATKVLKDGDLVEVDANNGIVKILKRGGKKNYIKIVKK